MKRQHVLTAIADDLRSLGFVAPAASAPAASAAGPIYVTLDGYAEDAGIGFTAHAGRAWMNHEATTAVLAMAAATYVRHGILLVPEHYKGSTAGANVVAYLRVLSTYDGVRLDLDQVAVVTY